MSERFYLDYNATAPLRPEVREAMIGALALTGNPSSVHAQGRAARAAVDNAREQVAALVSAQPEDVIFTSGGTEANALALHVRSGNDWHYFVSAIEHPSVLANLPAGSTQIPVSSDGIADFDWLAATVEETGAKGCRSFVFLMLANNETGAIQPVRRAAEIVHAAGGLIHTDAVQAPGRIALNINELDVDLLTLSAHKIGGPKGVGALILKPGTAIEPLLKGWGQEGRRRAGTENVAGIVGFGVAAEIVREYARNAQDLDELRGKLEEGARALVPDAVIVSSAVPRLPNTSCIAVAGAKAETLVIGLDLAGIAVSAGSACSSGKVEASHVLTAMRVDPEIAAGAIRISLGFSTRNTDIQVFLKAWSELVARLTHSRKVAA